MLTCSRSRVEKRFDFGGESGHLVPLRGKAAVLKERDVGINLGDPPGLCLGVSVQPDLYRLPVVKCYW